MEDPNVYMNRFNQQTWERFVMARKPTPVVCNLPEKMEDLSCLEIDVKSCGLHGIIEGNAHDIVVCSPLDEFTWPVEGLLADYSWVDIGHLYSPLASFIYDGPR